MGVGFLFKIDGELLVLVGEFAEPFLWDPVIPSAGWMHVSETFGSLDGRKVAWGGPVEEWAAVAVCFW